MSITIIRLVFYFISFSLCFGFDDLYFFYLCRPKMYTEPLIDELEERVRLMSIAEYHVIEYGKELDFVCSYTDDPPASIRCICNCKLSMTSLVPKKDEHLFGVSLTSVDLNLLRFVRWKRVYNEHATAVGSILQQLKKTNDHVQTTTSVKSVRKRTTTSNEDY
jgi:hypothetical protein